MTWTDRISAEVETQLMVKVGGKVLASLPVAMSITVVRIRGTVIATPRPSWSPQARAAARMLRRCARSPTAAKRPRSAAAPAPWRPNVLRPLHSTAKPSDHARRFAKSKHRIVQAIRNINFDYPHTSIPIAPGQQRCRSMRRQCDDQRTASGVGDVHSRVLEHDAAVVQAGVPNPLAPAKSSIFCNINSMAFVVATC